MSPAAVSTLEAGILFELPLVSVIVRSSDRPTLDAALTSIAAQDYPNIEIVVVNAKGSSHRRLPDRWENRLTIFVDADQAVPRATAANRGLGAARGEWVWFLDDDDYVAPSHVANLVAVAAREGYRVVYCHCQAVDAQDKPLPVCFDEPYDPVKLLAGNFLPIHTVLFHRSLVDEGACFDEALERFEDWDFWLQLAERAEFGMVSEVTAFYRIGAATGFGVRADPEDVRKSALAIAEKWRYRISVERFLELMEQARQWRFTARLLRDLAVLGVETSNAEEAARRLPSLWATIQRELASQSADLAKARQEQIRLNDELNACHDLLAAIHASTSWRLTAPLRALVAGWRSVVK